MFGSLPGALRMKISIQILATLILGNKKGSVITIDTNGW
jgi:hypothetical protein